jgi:hypothetical protein
MKRVLSALVLAAAAAIVAVAVGAAPSQAGPITKQNGSNPAFEAFTSICSVAGYADYGLCGGDVTRFTQVKGKMNAVQPKLGRYNLDFSFTGLTPGVEYRLWATRDAIPYNGTYFEVGRAFADAAGNAAYKLQTTSPGGLGFDLNTVLGDVTIVTSWWSGQYLVVNADGTISWAGAPTG